MTADTKLMIAALELLTKQIANLPLQIAENVGKTAEEVLERQHATEKSKLDTLGFGRDEGFGGNRQQTGNKEVAGGQNQFLTKLGGQIGGVLGKGGDKLADGAGKAGGMLMARFAAVLGPLAVFGQILNANISGFQVMGTAVKVLATTLAPILLPVLVAMSAGILAISDVLMERLLPAMDTWFAFVLGTLIPAISFLVDCFDDAADIVEAFANATQEAIDWIKRQADSLNPFSDDDATEARDAVVNRGGGEEKTDRGLTDTLRSLRMSMSPRANVMGLEGIGQSVTTAAIQSDPIDARMLKIQTDMLNKLDRIAANTNKRVDRAYDPATTGGGDYERGSDSADTGDYGGGP